MMNSVENLETYISPRLIRGPLVANFIQRMKKHSRLLPDSERRVDLYNLYPLLVHVNLFGGSYVHSVESILRIFR